MSGVEKVFIRSCSNRPLLCTRTFSNKARRSMPREALTNFSAVFFCCEAIISPLRLRTIPPGIHPNSNTKRQNGALRDNHFHIFPSPVFLQWLGAVPLAHRP